MFHFSWDYTYSKPHWLSEESILPGHVKFDFACFTVQTRKFRMLAAPNFLSNCHGFRMLTWFLFEKFHMIYMSSSLRDRERPREREMAGLFDKQAKIYADARPTYPREWYQKLAALTPRQALAWDVGTGNGQAALGVFSLSLSCRVNSIVLMLLYMTVFFLIWTKTFWFIVKLDEVFSYPPLFLWNTSYTANSKLSITVRRRL